MFRVRPFFLLLLLKVFESIVSSVASTDPIEVFYLSSRRNAANDAAMERLFREGNAGLKHHRLESIHIPENINYDFKAAMHPCKDSIEPLTLNASFLNFTSIRVTSLCMPPQNTARDIESTLSHLNAILTALMSENSHPYALILEDDVDLPFRIDFEAFESEFPSHPFGLLQLLVKHDVTLRRLLYLYKSSGALFSKSNGGYFTAGAYLINKDYFRRELTDLLKLAEQEGEEFEINLIVLPNQPTIVTPASAMPSAMPSVLLFNESDATGNSSSFTPSSSISLSSSFSASSYCVPSLCCKEDSISGKFSYSTTFPCISAKSIAPDSFLPRLVAGVVTSTLPIVTANYQSAAAPNAVGLRRGLEIVKMLMDGEIPMPSFLQARKTSFEDALEVFYLSPSLSGSPSDAAMRKHLSSLGLPFQRVESIGINASDMSFDLNKASFPCRTPAPPLSLKSTPFFQFSSITIANMCVPLKTSWSDIASTLSHLKAIYAALTSDSDREYALIIEEGNQILFEVNFAQLARYAPSDAGIVQIHIPNQLWSRRLFRLYEGKDVLFVAGDEAYASTTGYIINKSILRPLLYKLTHSPPSKSNAFTLDLLAGGEASEGSVVAGDKKAGAQPPSSCFPVVCCKDGVFTRAFPCTVLNGLPMSQYVLSLAHLHASTLSLITKGTLRDALISPRGTHEAIKRLYKGEVKLPPYLRLRNNSMIYSDD